MSLQVETLRESFKKVKPQADDFVDSFYDNLFTDYPAAKPLFQHSDMKKQATMLKACLLMVVENLRRPGALQDMLSGLGTRHVEYGALPEHYPLVGNSLLKTFEQYLKEDWTPEVKQAWVEAYAAITALMLEGAQYSEDEVALETNTTSEVNSQATAQTSTQASPSESPIAVMAPTEKQFSSDSNSESEMRSPAPPTPVASLSTPDPSTASVPTYQNAFQDAAPPDTMQPDQPEEESSGLPTLPIVGGVVGIGAVILTLILLL